MICTLLAGSLVRVGSASDQGKIEGRVRDLPKDRSESDPYQIRRKYALMEDVIVSYRNKNRSYRMHNPEKPYGLSLSKTQKTTPKACMKMNNQGIECINLVTKSVFKEKCLGTEARIKIRNNE